MCTRENLTLCVMVLGGLYAVVSLVIGVMGAFVFASVEVEDAFGVPVNNCALSEPPSPRAGRDLAKRAAPIRALRRTDSPTARPQQPS